jgi:hypothetical protein
VRKQNRKKKRFWIFGRFVCKNVSTRFVFTIVFGCVFELPSLRNTQNREKNKEVEEALTMKFSSIALEKVFDMDLCKNGFAVFVYFPCRATSENALKKK